MIGDKDIRFLYVCLYYRGVPQVRRADPQRDSDDRTGCPAGLRGRKPARIQGKSEFCNEGVGLMDCFRWDYWIAQTTRDRV